MSFELTLNNLSFRYGSNVVFDSLSTVLAPGIHALVGANGSGKSTLIKCIAGVLSPDGEVALIDGDTIRRGASLRERTSYLPQSLPATAALTVFEAVLLGLIGSLGVRVRDEQLASVADSLALLGIEHLASKRLDRLSGGQQQMVSLAQALVRRPDVLLLDEPLNSLDIRYQFEILSTIRDISRGTRQITLIAIHDLNLAGKYADRVIALHRKRIYSQGTPAQVLTEPMVRDLYGMSTEITLRESGAPHVRLIGVAEQGEGFDYAR